MSVLGEVQKLRKQLEQFNEDFHEQVNQIFDEYEKTRTDLRSYMYKGYVQRDTPPKETSENLKEPGKIRVGRILKNKEKSKKLFAVTDGYENIIVTSHNTSKLGHSLSPYVLKDSKGRIMENIWQFAKIYVQVTAQRQKSWMWEPEVHALHYKKIGRLDNSKITPEYWKWRNKGINHNQPVRYPNGFNGKDQCICCLWPKSNNLDDIDDPYQPMEQLDYITARKKVYAPIYIELAKQTEEFAELKAKLDNGENLQIMDVDGPDDTIYDGKKPYPYDRMTKGIHGVTSGVGSIDINRENIRAVLNDPTQPFGHGYCLAVALLGKEEWLK